jgi:predicted nucleic acid-binding protein
MPASRVVFDASVAVRAAVDENEDAISWFSRAEGGEVAAAWPDLVFVEVASGVATLVRAGRLAADRGARALAYALTAPVRVVSLVELVVPALAVATARSLSVYDACYVVLAEATDSALVTADRRLAAATSNAVQLAG